MGFLGKKMMPALARELVSSLSTSIEGTCSKHRMGKNSIKIYDKFGRVLRIETSSNDVSLFKRHRKVEHRDGHATRELASVKKSYSLIDLRALLLGCNWPISNSFRRSTTSSLAHATSTSSRRPKMSMGSRQGMQLL